MTNNIKQQSNNVKQQFSQIVENLSTILSFFTREIFFFEIKTFSELSNIVENDAIFIFNFDFSNTLNVVNNEIQRILDRYSKFRLKRAFFVDFLIDLIIFFKISFVNSYEFKIYKQTIINIYHKIKWQFEINKKMKFHKNNETWVLIIFVSINRKIFIEK